MLTVQEHELQCAAAAAATAAENATRAAAASAIRSQEMQRRLLLSPLGQAPGFAHGTTPATTTAAAIWKSEQAELYHQGIQKDRKFTSFGKGVSEIVMTSSGFIFVMHDDSNIKAQFCIEKHEQHCRLEPTIAGRGTEFAKEDDTCWCWTVPGENELVFLILKFGASDQARAFRVAFENTRSSKLPNLHKSSRTCLTQQNSRRCNKRFTHRRPLRSPTH